MTQCDLHSTSFFTGKAVLNVLWKHLAKKFPLKPTLNCHTFNKSNANRQHNKNTNFTVSYLLNDNCVQAIKVTNHLISNCHCETCAVCITIPYIEDIKKPRMSILETTFSVFVSTLIYNVVIFKTHLLNKLAYTPLHVLLV